MNWFTKWFKREPKPSGDKIVAVVDYDSLSAITHATRKPEGGEQLPIFDQYGIQYPPEHPLARAINKSWKTGKPVFWQEGDPLP